MELKTKIHAENHSQELFITRFFDLPLPLLFRAYEDPEIVEQWMGTKVVQLENHKFGLWKFETYKDNQMVFSASGVILDFVSNERITRTFEMGNGFFPVQLEFLTFEKVDESSSKLTIQQIFKSVEVRNQLLELPFAHGLNMAHDKLQNIVKQLK